MKMQTPYGVDHASRWHAALVVPALVLLLPLWLVALGFELFGFTRPIVIVLDAADWLMTWAGFEGP